MEKEISISGIIEIIGYIILVSIILGVIGTSIWIAIIAFRADPDHEDEDDQEIYEHEFWKRQNSKRKK